MSAPGGPLPSFPALDNTLGAYFIATFAGIVFYGITLQQCFRYYRLYPSDHKWLKALVIVVMLFETLHTILCLHVCYFYVNMKATNPFLLATAHGPRSLQTLPVSSGIIIFISHGYFARRAYLVGPSFRWFLYIAIALLVGELGFSAAATAKAYALTTIDSYAKVLWLISVACGMTTVTDVFLAAVFIDALHRNRTGFKRTETMINTLILYAIGTGVLTSIFVLLSFVFSIISPRNEIYAAFSMDSSKLYANMLMVALNSRKSFHETTVVGSDASTWPFGFTSIPSHVIRGDGPVELREFNQTNQTQTVPSVIRIAQTTSVFTKTSRDCDVESHHSEGAMTKVVDGSL